MSNQFDFIAIEGVIGAGKTSLANLLAEKKNARVVLEEFEENPFLPKFYEDRERYAFQTQLAFLASRFKQQQNMMSQDLFSQLTISDYIFDKDRIFARLNLDDDEMALYDNIYGIMSGIAPQPDLVIFVQSSVERLMENITKRGRDYEKHITPEYLKELNDAYNHFFYHYTRSPLITINATEIDFVNNPDHLKYIEQQIFEMPLHSNTHIHIAP
ncbi:deoxynucleoside kinase [Balneola vulgaris]|jgi:deoxyadenosine/deoxycytidine kinase|uniref:deoxynucleoside kinase n=1 Tax=Balneola vulgaris TaxID=287535 RepID=UPI00035FA515|nr:deoxynucleoside kinase [Balneola vulgaris]